MRNILFGAVLAVTLAIAAFGFWRLASERQLVEASETYIQAIASGDVDAALAVSSGSAAWSASRLKEGGIAAKVKDAEYSVAALGRGWARVQAVVELELQDGSVDAGWYSLDVAKTGRDWKVISFQEAGPELSGVSLFTRQPVAEAAQRVFQQYLDALAAGDWKGASKLLAGPARRSQEMGAVLLGKGTVIGKVEDLRSEPVWMRGREMIARFSYRVDGRGVSVTAVFHKTNQGWKIVRVLQN